jgi:uncharacterized membrane protein YphA (DoxX/SURF4 family)
VTLDGVGYVAAVALATIFAVAAISKLRSLEATVRSFEELGVPNPASAARLLPFPELAASVLLLVVPAVGGMVVLVLLAFFTTFLVNRLRAGVEAPCACFGAPGERPLSWLTLGRNALLAILALASLLTMQPAVPTPLDVIVILAPAVALTVISSVVARARRSRSLHQA